MIFIILSIPAIGLLCWRLGYLHGRANGRRAVEAKLVRVAAAYEQLERQR